jgi:hypothetical protein
LLSSLRWGAKNEKEKKKMSANLDGYLNALGQSRKLNKEAEQFADLMIGARRGAGAPSGSSPLGYMPGVPQHARSLYGNGGGVGQSSALQPQGNGVVPPGGPGYGCQPGTTLPLGAPVGGPCPPEFLCDCDLIGVSTLLDPDGPIPTNVGRLITVTDFDAVALQPVAIWFSAFVADANVNNIGTIANPVVEVPVIIDRVDVGQQGQLRTAGLGNSLNSAAFAATREPVCIDWAPFRSQNGQELTMEVFNPVTGFDPGTGVHFFAVFWTNVLS